MKKIVLSFLFACVAMIATQAQGVKFESGTWTEILAKAKAENKPVFVDVYTTWCGPCKYVAQNVFPQEEMGEFYNPRFINFKMDAESPAGKEFVETYPVGGYPTFFFIDGDGKVVHKLAGAKDVNGFISEAKMVSMYARHGGAENMSKAIKNGTASKEMLYDFYSFANGTNKPKALNLYLKALPAEELVDENSNLVKEVFFYDKELMTRLIDETVKASNDGRFANGKYAELFASNIVFAIHYSMSTFLDKSIRDGNEKWLNELLELKERFTGYAGQFCGLDLSLNDDSNYGRLRYGAGRLLDGDLYVMRGRGLFFASPTYINLCYWSNNRVNEEKFKSTLVSYMDELIRDNHVDSLITGQRKHVLDMLKKEGIKGPMRGFALDIFEIGNMTAHNMIAWADYFWKISPSDKKTRELCSKWINYAFNMNSYNARVAVPAADLLSRIGNFKDAKVILEKAIACQKEVKNDNQRELRGLELKLQDVNNGKL